MFNIGSWPTVMKSVVESANSGLESANFNADSNADPEKKSLHVGMGLYALDITKSTRHSPVRY